jgi:mRNA interferase MazF
MAVSQGEVYWAELAPPSGSRPGYRHPVVVIQNDVFNRSRIRTVVACALTSNLRRAAAPGNVRLAKGEAGLPKRSVVNVSQIMTLDKADLVEKIGTLPRRRLEAVLGGVYLLLEPMEVEQARQ